MIVVPALGGPEREVVETQRGTQTYRQQLSWSPDSRMLVLAASTPTTRESLIAVDVATGETRPIPIPPASIAHTMPAIAPDGKTLAFVRHSGGLTGELYVQRIPERPSASAARRARSGTRSSHPTAAALRSRAPVPEHTRCGSPMPTDGTRGN
ncbi:MAG TPA: hypothetical protein VHJ58_12190 [Vicinamibacterales bacterium]|nr:hypothetical protein [Vicinamibacterales bacterium]